MPESRCSFAAYVDCFDLITNHHVAHATLHDADHSVNAMAQGTFRLLEVTNICCVGICFRDTSSKGCTTQSQSDSAHAPGFDLALGMIVTSRVRTGGLRVEDDCGRKSRPLSSKQV